MEYCPSCQCQTCTYKSQDHYNDVKVTRIICMGCNREIYNYTDSEAILKVKTAKKTAKKLK